MPNEIISKGHIMYHHYGNNVDIEHEMTKLAQNQKADHSFVDQWNNKFNNLLVLERWIKVSHFDDQDNLLSEFTKEDSVDISLQGRTLQL